MEHYSTYSLLNNYLKAINIFKTDPTISKVGMFPAPGYMWYNFFYVRGTYLLNSNPPKISSRRFYYEEYLLREYKLKDKPCEVNINDEVTSCPFFYNNKPINDSYSLYSDKIKQYEQYELFSISLEDEINKLSKKN